jgi:uncharacterized coiled-coil protein SlyX
MDKIKKYLPEIIVIVLVVGLICTNVYTYFKGKYENDEIITVRDSLLVRMRNDSTAVKILEDANVNCLNSTAAKIDYYETKIKNINRQVEKDKIIIDRLQQQKNSIDQKIKDVDTTKLSTYDLLNFINTKY